MITRDGPLLAVLLAVSLGAAIGASTRWFASYLLNSWGPFPFGTLLVNLVGSFLIGFLVVYFSNLKELNPYIYLAVITGFLGSLTTFSTFSNENISLLLSGQYIKSLVHAGSHLFGSLIMTYLGVVIAKKFLE